MFKSYKLTFQSFPSSVFLILCLVIMGSLPLFWSANKARAAQYVTPQMYGAAADGTNDDTIALQKAINSGYPVYLPKGRYYITRTINVYSKKNLRVQGSSEALIHRRYEKSARAFLFQLQDCETCVFRDLNITSEIKGTGTAPYGHTRPGRVSSNILAFGGKNNRNIYFYNNSFTNMESDYWFNDDGAGWRGIVISGWHSRKSINALFGQKCTDLQITGADVILNPDLAGDGDHCIYLAEGSSGIRISKSTFDAGLRADGTCFAGAVLNFYRTSKASSGSYVGDVTISDIVVKGERFIYGNCGSRETITVRDCSFEQTYHRGSDYTGAFGGNANYKVYDSNITVNSFTITGNHSPDTHNSFTRCRINAKSLDSACFANPTKLTLQDCSIKLGKILVYVHEKNSDAQVTINNCDIEAYGNSYLLSKRNDGGTLTVNDCRIDKVRTANYMVYNGNAADMTGFNISDSVINGYRTIASRSDLSNAVI